MALPPKTYQLAGIDFLTNRTRAILGDDAGLGKSMQMIRAANRVSAQRIMVLCPAVGRLSWGLQFAEWDERQRPVVALPDRTLAALPRGPLSLIVTMDYVSDRARLDKFRKMLKATDPFDVVIIDEAHYIKNPSAQRTRAIYGHRLDLGPNSLIGLVDATHVWAASATLTPLNASELYPHMKALFPTDLAAMFGGNLPNLFQFTQKFCVQTETRFGWKITGNRSDTIPMLRDALRPHFLMRLKSQVLAELPPILTDVLPLDAAGARTNKAPEVSVDTNNLSDEEFLLAIRDAAQNDPGFSEARRELGEAKAKAFVPWLRDYMDADRTRKVIVFCHHRATIQTLMDAGNTLGLDPVAMHGGSSTDDKSRAVASFQDPASSCRLFVGQIRAAGTSITLTAANTVVLLEPDPSPLNNYQAISRAHRLGQTSDVNAFFAFAATDPIDRRMSNVLRRRAKDFEHLFGANLPGSI